MVLKKIDHSTLSSQVISFLMHLLSIMSRRATELRRSLPQQHPQWVKPCVKDCIVLNEDSYKAYFGEHALKRVSGK